MAKPDDNAMLWHEQVFYTQNGMIIAYCYGFHEN